MSPFTRRVWSIVRSVPRGHVVSYGGVAALMGAPRAARAVGRALCALPDGSDVPWWRVINRNGEISIRCMLHGPQVQRALLEAEGVRFDRHGRVDWKRFGWDPRDVTDPDDDVVIPGDAGERRPSRSRPRSKRTSKRSVALVIHEPGRTGRILLVQRPPDDPDLPRVWGLPAATLQPGEDWEAAARRAGREKLAVVVRLRGLRAEGRADRATGNLRMRLFDATRARGTPRLDLTPRGVTRYNDWRWGDLEELRPGADRGSLCCRLALGGRGR